MRRLNRYPSPNPRRAFIRRIRRIAWRREGVVRRHTTRMISAARRGEPLPDSADYDWAVRWLVRHKHILRDGSGA